MHLRGFIGVHPQGDPLAGPPGHPEGFGWNDGMSVNPNNTRLKCAWDDYSCTADPDDTLFFERMVSALRVTGATGHLYVFGQSNGAAWAQRLGANAGPALPFMGVAPQSGQLNARPPRSAAGPRNLNQPRCGNMALGPCASHPHSSAMCHPSPPRRPSPMAHPTHAVWRALLRAQACRMLTEACDVVSKFN